MADKVKLSKDGSSIDFVQSDSIPTSLKKFRQSPEIEGFYRFIFENDLQKEAYEILERIVHERKAKKAAEKAALKEAAKAEKASLKVKEAPAAKNAAATPAKATPTALKAAPPAKKAAPAPAKAAAKPAAKAIDKKKKKK